MTEILNSTGIDGNRLKMFFCSSAEGQKFKEIAIEFDKEIRELGPNPLRVPSKDSSKKKKK